MYVTVLEKTIQANIIAYLQKLPGCTAENVHGSKYQVGRPDINACYQGRLIRMEVKTPDHGNKPSEIQKENLRKWARAGAICFVAYSLEEVKQVISEKGLRCDHWACKDCPVRKEYCYSKHGGYHSSSIYR